MNPFYKNLSLWLVIILMMVMLYNIFNQNQPGGQTVPYSEFISQVESGNVTRVTIQNKDILVTDSNNASYKVFSPMIPS